MDINAVTWGWIFYGCQRSDVGVTFHGYQRSDVGVTFHGY